MCKHDAVGVRHLAVVIGTASLASWAPLTVQIPSVSAQPCPDVEVVFARGTTELPGVGPTGQAFVDSLRSRLAGKSVDVYAVDYPATMAFSTALDGINDASTHVLATAASCPNTQMVLGGFSQGAAVAGFVTANVIPDGAPSGVPNPMPTDVAKHVAAVTLLGKPNNRFMNAINEPAIVIGPAYAGKTIDLCVPDDAICSGGTDFNAHMQYVESGLVDQAATYAADRVLANSRPAAPQSPPAAATAPVPAAPAPSPAPAAPAPAAPPPAAPAPAAPAQPADPNAPAPPPAHPPLPSGTLLLCTTGCQVLPST
jgi:cutinase